MHGLVTHRIPYLLAGSIRDDGPLPDVIPDTLAAQDAMRSHTSGATVAIFVDQTEFVVTKLRDRGTHQAYGVVTNAQDFMHVLRFYVERWQQASAPALSPR